MNEARWPPEVAQLLELGKVSHNEQIGEWLDYRELGLRAEHGSELTAMATDFALNTGDDDAPSTWGPLHAWRALGQFHAVEALQPLIDLLDEIEDEWLAIDFPRLCQLLGSRALPVLQANLIKGDRDELTSSYLVFGIEAIGKKNPETRRECIRILRRQLEQYAENSEVQNGELIHVLLELHDKSSLVLMARAFDEERVDGFLTSWGDVQNGYRLRKNMTPEDVLNEQADS